MVRLLALFILLPAVELALLIEIGGRIGTLPTFALILATGAIGAALARREGIGVVGRVQRELDEGNLPATSLVDAVLILVAGALLITPGVITDLVGFGLLTPVVRGRVRAWLWGRFERAMEEGRVHVAGRVHVDPTQGPSEPPRVIRVGPPPANSSRDESTASALPA
jgi:UPF0716 protein FxsA